MHKKIDEEKFYMRFFNFGCRQVKLPEVQRRIKQKELNRNKKAAVDKRTAKHIADFNASLFNSAEHQQFCETYGVGGAMEDYTSWHKFTHSIEQHLPHGQYHRIIVDLRKLFNLPSQDSAFIPSGNDQLIHHASPKSEEKEAYDIWTHENVLKLLAQFIRRCDQITLAYIIELESKFFPHIVELINTLRENNRMPRLPATPELWKQRFHEIKSIRFEQLPAREQKKP